jgi:mono/diheme cytochrome c family protein
VGNTTIRLEWPVVLVIVIFIVFSALFVIVFLSGGAAAEEQPVVLTADTYMDEVNRLLEGADPARGQVFVETYGCSACHVLGGERVAPPFEGLATIAAERRPPLTAAAYIYEAIIYPGVHLVEGYPNSMVQDYRERIPPADLGDIIAYLLTKE